MNTEDMINRRQFAELTARGFVAKSHGLSQFAGLTYGESATSLINALLTEDSLDSDCESWGFTADVWRRDLTELLELMMQKAVDDDFGVVDVLSGYGDNDLVIGLREYPDGSFDAFYQDNDTDCTFDASADDWNEIVDALPSGVRSDDANLFVAIFNHFQQRGWIPKDSRHRRLIAGAADI